jgi:hypothetical protein
MAVTAVGVLASGAFAAAGSTFVFDVSGDSAPKSVEVVFNPNDGGDAMLTAYFDAKDAVSADIFGKSGSDPSYADPDHKIRQIDVSGNLTKEEAWLIVSDLLYNCVPDAGVNITIDGSVAREVLDDEKPIPDTWMSTIRADGTVSADARVTAAEPATWGNNWDKWAALTKKGLRLNVTLLNIAPNSSAGYSTDELIRTFAVNTRNVELETLTLRDSSLVYPPANWSEWYPLNVGKIVLAHDSGNPTQQPFLDFRDVLNAFLTDTPDLIEIDSSVPVRIGLPVNSTKQKAAGIVNNLIAGGLAGNNNLQVNSAGNSEWWTDSELSAALDEGPVPGPEGPAGADGKDGVDGADGKDGADGVDGKNGKNGCDAGAGGLFGLLALAGTALIRGKRS